MFHFLASLVLAVSLAMSPAPAEDPVSIVPVTPHVSASLIYLPDVSDDPEYGTDDVFLVTSTGDVFRVGYDQTIRSDVDWLVVEGTALPSGYYTLNGDGWLIPSTPEPSGSTDQA